MQIWLKGSRRFRFPVIPGEYSVTGEREIETVNVNAIGETDLIGKCGLRTVTFSSFFPKNYDHGYCEYSSLKSPKNCVKIIEQKQRGAPAKLIMTGTPINFRVTITSFSWKEQDRTGEIYFTITMKEHRNVSIGQSRVVALGE